MGYEEEKNESRRLAEPEVVYGVDKRLKAANITRRKNIRRNTESDIQMELEDCLRIYRTGGPATRTELIPRMEQYSALPNRSRREERIHRGRSR